MPGGDGKEKLLLIAKQAGFSKEKFDQCLADKELFNKIVETRTRGNEEFGVDSTPSFFVNGKRLTGEHTLQDFETALCGWARPATERRARKEKRRASPRRLRSVGVSVMRSRAARASILIAVAAALVGCGGGAVGPGPADRQGNLCAAASGADGAWAARRARARQGRRARHRDRICLAHLSALRQFPEDLFPRMKKEFIDTGKVRYIVREFPIGRTAGNGGHRQSLRAGRQIFLPARPVPDPADRMGQPGGPPRRHLCGRQSRAG